LTVSAATELAVVHKTVEHDLTRRRMDAEQTSRLLEVQRQAGHFAVGADDRRDQV
jgi:hypothetical protein